MDSILQKIKHYVKCENKVTKNKVIVRYLDIHIYKYD